LWGEEDDTEASIPIGIDAQNHRHITDHILRRFYTVFATKPFR